MLKAIMILMGSLVLFALVFVSGVVITANVIAEPEPHKFANVDTPDLWTAQPKAVDLASQDYERLPSAQSTAAKTGEALKTPDGKLLPSNPVDQTTAAMPAAAPAPITSSFDNTVTASIAPEANGSTLPNPVSGNVNTGAPMQQNSAVPAAQAQSCFARYRSYRVEDNSYQPFDGGPRRQCQISGQPSEQVAIQTMGQMRGEVTSVRPARDVATVRPMPPQVAPRYRNDMPPLPPEAIPLEEDNQVYGAEPEYRNAQAAEAAAPAGSHEEWCFNRYRSYRADDNSYQPFEGGSRRACQSPFG